MDFGTLITSHPGMSSYSNLRNNDFLFTILSFPFLKPCDYKTDFSTMGVGGGGAQRVDVITVEPVVLGRAQSIKELRVKDGLDPLLGSSRDPHSQNPSIVASQLTSI